MRRRVVRISAIVVASLTAIAAVASCFVASRGGEGEPCKCDGCGFFGGRFYCDDGLVCNTGAARYICQEPGSVGAGGACNAWEYVEPKERVLCAEGLTCTFFGRIDASSSARIVPCAPLVSWCCEPLPPPPCGPTDPTCKSGDASTD